MKIPAIFKKCTRILPDELYLRLAYRFYFSKSLNLRKPTTYSEKLQWLKLYYRRADLSTIVDKYEAKKYIANIIGDNFIIPTIGVWDFWDDIDFNSLPNSFVLKTTHDSGGVVIVKDKTNFDILKARQVIEKSLNHNFYYSGREWPYKNVKPRIIAENYMEDKQTSELRDYKFFTFNGKAKVMFIASERQSKKGETKFDFFDMDFKHLPFTNGHPNAIIEPQKPTNFDLMIELSETLSKGFPHLRVDFYEVDGRVYVGELTLFHWSGLVPFKPEEWDEILGSWLELPSKIS